MKEGDFLTLVENLWFDRVETKDRRVVFAQYCITNGWVKRDHKQGFNLCDNPNCLSCVMFGDEIKKAVEEVKINLDE